MNLHKDNFFYKEVAYNIALNGIDNLNFIVDAISMSWKGLQHSNDPAQFLYVKSELFTCLGCAYALREKKLFRKAEYSFFEYQIYKSTSLKPKPEELFFELYMSCAFNQQQTALAISNYLISEKLPSKVFAEDLIAHTVACFIKNELQEIPFFLDKINEICSKRIYLKQDNEYYQLVANTGLSLLNKSVNEFTQHLKELDNFNFKVINKEITKCAEGKPTQINGSYFFDPLSATFLRIGVNSGLISMPTIPYSSFDIEWIDQ